MAANVGYDVLHTAVMIGVFHRYGLDPWVYVLYIVGFSVGFAWSSLALIGALVDRRPRRAWPISAVTVVCFFAPELFLLTTTHHVPRYVYVLLGGYVACSSTLAAVALVRRYRARRDPARGRGVVPAGSPDAAAPEWSAG